MKRSVKINSIWILFKTLKTTETNSVISFFFFCPITNWLRLVRDVV